MHLSGILLFHSLLSFCSNVIFQEIVLDFFIKINQHYLKTHIPNFRKILKLNNI